MNGIDLNKRTRVTNRFTPHLLFRYANVILNGMLVCSVCVWLWLCVYVCGCVCVCADLCVVVRVCVRVCVNVR